jgi:WD40 repeat protein
MYVAAGATNGDIYLWDLQTKTCKWQTMQGEGEVQAMQFAPADRILATAGSDGTLRMWDVETGNELSRIDPGGTITGLCFSPGRNRIYTFDHRGRLHCWLGPNSSARLAREIRLRL